MFKNISEFLKDIICPPTCVSCGSIESGWLCSNCRSKIKTIRENICIYCGRPISENKIVLPGCNFCMENRYMFFRHRSFGLYKGVIKDIICKYKYGRIYTLKGILTDFLINAYDLNYGKEKIEGIETVPGEHMEILAAELSSSLKLPYLNNIIAVKKAVRQKGLGLDNRKYNVKGAFKIKNNLMLKGKNIMVIDDVWTTGSTLNEICRILKNCGTDKIYLLTIARGN